MNAIANQLLKLIKVNRKIINQFHKDEADVALLQKRFNERGRHVTKLASVTEVYDASSLSNSQKKRLTSLFERFEDQQRSIQEALDYILEKSKERLDDAIKKNKAEKSYKQVLKR
ncbi:hypothetical protein [Fodinibius salsisoli]|uniref:Uncharacterized protein n=1 Tax=Fodinibius salsisoli TaxID=2820877 RepID=A0ABT3PHF0_9BACT|nr:hypothetical protein [Fodinibius salsisoli]MCW9705346.1 hypothetical protein [Fodinibius salsisoli]